MLRLYKSCLVLVSQKPKRQIFVWKKKKIYFKRTMQLILSPCWNNYWNDRIAISSMCSELWQHERPKETAAIPCQLRCHKQQNLAFETSTWKNKCLLVNESKRRNSGSVKLYIAKKGIDKNLLEEINTYSEWLIKLTDNWMQNDGWIVLSRWLCMLFFACFAC